MKITNNEDDQQWRWLKNKTTKNEDYSKLRWPKNSPNKKSDYQILRWPNFIFISQPKWKITTHKQNKRCPRLNRILPHQNLKNKNSDYQILRWPNFMTTKNKATPNPPSLNPKIFWKECHGLQEVNIYCLQMII